MRMYSLGDEDGDVFPSRLRKKLTRGHEPEPVHISQCENGLLHRAVESYGHFRPQGEGVGPHKKIRVQVGKLTVFGTYAEWSKAASRNNA